MKEPTTHYAALAPRAQIKLIREASASMINALNGSEVPLSVWECSFIHAQAATIMAACEATLKPEGMVLKEKRKKP